MVKDHYLFHYIGKYHYLLTNNSMASMDITAGYFDE